MLAAPEPGMGPFIHSSYHLLAELERIDLLIRSRVAHLRRVQSEDENFRGLYISEQEVDALLARPLGEPQWLHGGDRGQLADVDTALQELSATIAQRRSASLEQGIDLRLDRLARIFRLDAFDVDVLLICLAVEVDLRYEKLYAYLQDDVLKRRPSVDLAVHLLVPPGGDRWAARRHFVASSPLVAHQLVHLLEDPQQPQSPLLARILKPDDSVVEFLFGIDELDARLREAVRVVTPRCGLDDLLLEQAARGAFRNAWPVSDTSVPAPDGGGSPVLVLQGPAGAGRSSVAEALCHERRCALLIFDASAVPPEIESLPASASLSVSAPTRWAGLANLVEREAALRGAAVLWRGIEALEGDAQRGLLTALLRAIDAGRWPCFIAASEAIDVMASFPRRGGMVMKMPEPTYAQRAKHWSAGLAGTGFGEDVHVSGLASRFKLSLGKITQAVATARRLAGVRAGAEAVVTAHDLQDACRLVSNQRLASLARKISPGARWSDIVLPGDRMAQLREICNHVKYRSRVYGDWGFGHKLALGKGLAVLFAGPSGTGKTMAAGILAAELGLDLYKIDLSTVISKYIGETEKNLSRIFDEAETSNAILFFDEADALFGKRSEVRDSHDRYANVEVGFLLQRMEEYEGIAILATNFRKNMDDAFVRRLHFTVEFPFPDQEDRYRIWQGIWPRDTPRDGSVDLELLSERYEMTGGNIKNIAVAAAFLAVDEGEVVRMTHVVQATLREYQKTGKLMVDDDFVIGEGMARR
jgi:ATPase family associated with various cellular activities (AAA)